MKLICCLIGLLFPLGPAVQEEGSVLTLEVGTITAVGDFGFGIVPDFDKGTRYAPDALDEAFQVDGLRVKFSGTIGSIPANVRGGGRMWGTPFKLTHVERLDPAPE